MEIYQALSDLANDGGAVVVDYLDFQKVFAEVPHRKLLVKMKTCGMAGRVANWI